MKKIDMARALGLADEEYVDEAAVYKKYTETKSSRWRTIVILAACLAVAASVMCSVIFFTDIGNGNTDDTSDLTDDGIPDFLNEGKYGDYFSIVKALYEYESGSVSDVTPGTEGSDLMSDYRETTDNQVDGIIEADLFKRTSTHIFYYNRVSEELYAYSVNGEDSKIVSSFAIESSYKQYTWLRGLANVGLFLSDDCNTLTLIGDGLAKKELLAEGTAYRKTTIVISLDVSDPENIKDKGSFAVNGDYLTSRLVDGKIIFLSSFYAQCIDNSDIKYLVPQTDTGAGFITIPAENIVMPGNLTSRWYTVVTQFDQNTFEIDYQKAYLGYSGGSYFSRDKFFLTSDYSVRTMYTEDGKPKFRYEPKTDILALSYGDGEISTLGEVTIDGKVKNQYSFDEYEGVLRVVTSTTTNAALYCIDTATWQIVAEIKDFAPEGEEVQSVRFDGTSAYVCTAVTMKFEDPVFFFDLSDMNNITYTDTGNIKGYSTSLVDFGEGFLLGIGYGDTRSEPKVEVYAEKDGKVVSVASYVFEVGIISEDYKSYFIDRERGLIGFQIDGAYVILHFDGTAITQKFIDGICDDRFPERARAILIDGYFYIMSADAFKVVKLAE